jgi:hypothetical protein
MTRSTPTPQGFRRLVQLLPGRLSLVCRAAAVLLSMLMMLVAASQASAMMKKLSRNTPGPSPEVRQMLTRLASVSTFRGLTSQETCRRAGQLKPNTWRRCTLDFGKTSITVAWRSSRTEVHLETSIPSEEQAEHRSAPLRWVNFVEVHRILCPHAPDVNAAMASLPQRLSQSSWKQSPHVSSEDRSVDVADAFRCRAHLTERRGDDQLRVMLVYNLYHSQR